MVEHPHVLHVAQSADYGLGRYVKELVADQLGRGWPVSFAGPEVELPPEVSWLPWPATRQPGVAVVDEARRLAALVASAAPDLVHLHSSKAGLAGRLAVRGKRPTIFQPHAWSFLAVSGATRQLAVRWERVGARWADIVLCGSESERQAGESAGITTRWEVVPNAVDIEAFAPADDAERRAARRRLGLPAGAPLAVCVSRLAVAQKGQDLLLAAWPHVRAAVADARLVLVGDGPDEAVLRAMADDSVVFAGRRDDVADHLAAADVVVQPSRYETLSLSVLEAMARGRCVVATDTLGMAEALGRDAGALVPLGDVDALAAAVVVRLQDPEKAAAEGRAGRERAARSHDLRGWGERMAEVSLDLMRR